MRRGWRAPLAVFAASLVLLGGPQALAAVRRPAGWAFLGGIGAVDYGSYLAKIEAGRLGLLACPNAMSPDPEGRIPAPGLWWPYLLIGHAARILGFGAPAAYHLARALLWAAALALLWATLRAVLPKGRTPLALALAALASASGLEFLGGRWEKAGFLVGGHVHMAAMCFPHYALTFAGWILAVRAWLDGGLGPRARIALVAAAGLLLSVHPFMLPLPALAALADTLLQGGGRWRAALRHGAALAAGALPGVAPLAWSLWRVPWVREWQGQVAPTASIMPPFPIQLLGFGVAGVLGMAAAVEALARRRPGLGYWAASALIPWALAYAGTMPRGGWQLLFFQSVPLGVLAAHALQEWRPLRRAKGLLTALAVWVGVAVLASAWAGAAEAPSDPAEGLWCVPEEYLEAGAWLREHARPGDAAGCRLEAGTLLPWLTGLRVRPYAGHPIETPGFPARFREAQALFEGSGGVPPGVRWVVEDAGLPQAFAPQYGERTEWRLQPLAPRARELGLELRFECGGIKVWEVVDSAAKK